MKKSYFLVLLLINVANAQIVDIPNAAFKAKLIQLGVDANSDGQIQQSEALATTNLTMPVSNITDLTGLQAFTNLTYLDCSNQANGSGPGLTSLNLSGLTRLTYLSCDNNAISSLDVSLLTNLRTLICNYNLLTSLNVAPLIRLTQLQCGHNQISALNLNSNTALTQLLCTSNQLTSLNLTSLNNLQELSCGENALGTLTVTNLHNLNNFSCMNAGLTSLDLSGLSNIQSLEIDANPITQINLQDQLLLNHFSCNNTLLTALDLSNAASTGVNFGLQFGNNPNLVYLNLKNAGNLIGFYPTGCPHLSFICANDDDIAFVNQELAYYGILGVNVNSYCSFTPAGNYNSITGTLTYDVDNNGCDSNDGFQQYTRISMVNGNYRESSFINPSGQYVFFTQAGSFTISPNVENPTWFVFSPPSATITFADNNNNAANQNFCVTSNGNHPDAEVIILPLTQARPGFDGTYKVIYKNKGNQVLSGTINFEYDDTILDFVSSDVVPALNSTGSLSYGYSNLLPFETRTFTIVLNLNGPMETPPVNGGAILDYTATVNPVSGDETPNDNVFHFNQTVVNSFDPNDVVCLEGNIVATAQIGNYLHYVINFENTGTAAAENIVVKDIINTAQFDVNSLQLLDSSAPVKLELVGNVSEFIFQNINLQAHQHGNVAFKIKSKNTLVQGNTVTQKASIYFDYNFPVITANENTTFQTLSNADIPTDATILVYPNPTKGNVNISCNNTLKSVALYDVQARLLQTNLVNENQATLDISAQSSGIYFVKIISDAGMAVQKIAKE